MIKEKDIQPGIVFEVIQPALERVSLYCLTPTPENGLTCGVIFNYDSFTVLKVEKDLANMMLYVMILGRDTPTYGWMTIVNYRHLRFSWVKRA